MSRLTKVQVSPEEFQKLNLREDGSFPQKFTNFVHRDFKILANELLNAGRLRKDKRKNYVIDDFNNEFYYTVLYYFSRNERFFKSPLIYDIENASFDKGLLLCGVNGAGKSFMFKTLNYMNSLIGLSGNNFAYNTSKKVVDEFNEKGHEAIKNYYKGQRYFDDIGAENEGNHYGKEEIFRLLLETRYESFIDNNMKTFGSTNYKQEDFLRYGRRAESRIYEMFNIVYAKSIDFRKK